MNKRKTVVLAAYTFCFICSLVYLFIYAKETAFCGLPAMMLTMPWSMILIMLANQINEGMFDSSILPGTVLIVISFLLNVGCILAFFKNKTSNQPVRDNA